MTVGEVLKWRACRKVSLSDLVKSTVSEWCLNKKGSNYSENIA